MMENTDPPFVDYLRREDKFTDYWNKLSYVGKEERLELSPDELNKLEKSCFEKRLAFFRGLRQKEFDDRAENKLEEYMDILDEYTPQGYLKTSSIKNDPNLLKEYLGNLISLESGIYAVKERLKQLYVQQIFTSLDAFASKSLFAKNFIKIMD